MSDSIIVAVISAIVTIASVLLSSKATQDKMTNELHSHNQVQDVKIDNLTTAVNKHNGLIERMYHVEQSVAVLENRQKVSEHRIDDIEHKI